MSKKRLSQERTGKLPPKPPEILQKIKWLHLNGQKHLKYIIIAVVILGLSWVGQHYLSDRISDNRPSDNTVSPDSNNPRLAVTFADGNRAEVELFATVRVNQNKIVYLISTYGEQSRALSEMMTALKSKGISELEKRTLLYVRKNRREVADAIRKACADDESRTAHTVESIDIGDIQTIGVSP